MNEEKIQIIKDNEIDLRALFQILWNDRKYLIIITTFVTILGIMYALRQTPLYKSTISIYPTGSVEVVQQARFKSMASAFGINTGSSQFALNMNDILYIFNLFKLLNYILLNMTKT